MIRGGNDRDQNHRRVAQPHQHVESFPPQRLSNLPFFQRAPKHARVVDHGAADDEGVAEMHARHRRQRVDVVTAHPDTGRVVVPHRIEEAVLGREQTRRHAGVEREG